LGASLIRPGELLVIRDESDENNVTLAVVSFCCLRQPVHNPITGSIHDVSSKLQLLISTQAWVLHISKTQAPVKISIVHLPNQGPDTFQLIISSEGEVEMFEDQFTIYNEDETPLNTKIITKTYYVNGEYLMSTSTYQGFRRERNIIMASTSKRAIQLLTHLVSSKKILPSCDLPDSESKDQIVSEDLLNEAFKISSCLN
jgi:hypothetical protein